MSESQCQSELEADTRDSMIVFSKNRINKGMNEIPFPNISPMDQFLSTPFRQDLQPHCPLALYSLP